jgi:hypothetical protein
MSQPSWRSRRTAQLHDWLTRRDGIGNSRCCRAATAPVEGAPQALPAFSLQRLASLFVIRVR